MKKISTLICIILCMAVQAQQKQKTYPVNLRWNNAKTEFGCKGDGLTDDTDSLRRAARTYKDIYHTNIVVYLPKGRYLISDSIKLLSDYYDANVTFLGEDPDSTFIILKNNAPGFQSAASPRPVIQTRAGNQAFGMYFQNLIISTGTGNPGAVGLDYITSNYGTVENVQIISGDGNAYCGLQMERAWPGPGLIKNVSITGFQYGIRITQCEYSMTFENIMLRNQTVCGLYANCNALAIRKLTSKNSVKVIQGEGGRITLLDSKFTGGNSGVYAVYNNNGSLFARNISTTGYAAALNINGTPIPGSNITEYHSGPDYSQFTNDGKSLNLPVSETPVYVNNDLTAWGKANDYDCLPTNPIYAYYDAGPGLQAAFNSGKKVIYFDKMGDNGSGYCIYNDIVVPPTVEMLIGFHHARFIFFNGSKLVINTKSNTPLFIDGMSGTNILNNSKRTVVFKASSLGAYSNTIKNAFGKVYLEDNGTEFKPQYSVNM
ncbi:MAG TPA: glycosyl hydrolase family 28-related protein, partial [Chitinophagaceae bacterium]|nr:glycosyl hydrolase family 28-related protein [Chitinophagaceae bacterium]